MTYRAFFDRHLVANSTSKMVYIGTKLKGIRMVAEAPIFSINGMVAAFADRSPKGLNFCPIRKTRIRRVMSRSSPIPMEMAT